MSDQEKKQTDCTPIVWISDHAFFARSPQSAELNEKELKKVMGGASPGGHKVWIMG
jgi:bacteriocin-like protein